MTTVYILKHLKDKNSKLFVDTFKMFDLKNINLNNNLNNLNNNNDTDTNKNLDSIADPNKTHV